MELHKTYARAAIDRHEADGVEILDMRQRLTLEVQEYETLRSLRTYIRRHAEPTEEHYTVTFPATAWETFFK